MSCEAPDFRHSTLLTIDLDRYPPPTECAHYPVEPRAAVHPRCVVAAANFDAVALTRLDGTRIVDLATGATRVTIPKCVGINTAASRDLRVIATVAHTPSRRHRLEVWSTDDANTFRAVGHFEYEGSDAWLDAPLAVSPDGRMVAFTRGTSPGSTLALWDVKGAHLRERWRLAQSVVALEEDDEHPAIGVAGSRVRFDVRTLDRLPDGTTPLPLPTESASAGDVHVRYDEHDHACVVTEGERERRVPLRVGGHGVGGFEREHVEPYPETVETLSADPPRAITCLTLAEQTEFISGAYGIVDERYEYTLWDLRDPPAHRVFATWTDMARLSPNGTRLGYATSRGGLVIVDTATLDVVRKMPFPSRIVEPGRTISDVRAGALAFSHDLRWIAAAWEAVAVLWRDGASEPVDHVDLTPYSDRITALAFVDHDRSLVVGTQRGLLLRFEISA